MWLRSRKRFVTVHGTPVILSVAKNLSWDRGPTEILRYAQNDGVFPARERLQRFMLLRSRKRLTLHFTPIVLRQLQQPAYQPLQT